MDEFTLYLEDHMTVYDKIIRDDIHKVIKGNGQWPVIEKVGDDRAIYYLYKKLQEELDEFCVKNDMEELVDLIEVIEAIIKKRGYSMEAIQKIKDNKKCKYGSFDKNIILKGVINDTCT